MNIEKIELADAIWYRCENEHVAFMKLKELLALGYTLENSQGLAIILRKNKDVIAITYLNIYTNISKLADFKEYVSEASIIRPDYNLTLLNVIGEIQNHFGGSNCYKPNLTVRSYLDSGKYENVVVLLLDGLGTTILNHHLPKDAFLRRHFKESLVSLYPSTTAAATTAIKSGLSPRVNGWTGWENYIKEADRSIVLFTGKDYFTEESTGINYFKLMPYEPFYKDLAPQGFMVEPDFKNKVKLKNELKRALKNIKNYGKTIQYVYTTEPDSTLHVKGLASKETHKVIVSLNKEVERFAKRLPENTLLIVTADHGHRDVSSIKLYECDILMNMLERMPANDSRALAFKVKEEFASEFPIIFNKLFGEIYELHPSKDLLKSGYFGNENYTNPRVLDFIGDYFALGINDYYMVYSKSIDPSKHIEFKSHHAGITANEMLVPLIVYGGSDENIID